jgi:hypothetical protein
MRMLVEAFPALPLGIHLTSAATIPLWRGVLINVLFTLGGHPDTITIANLHASVATA